ncbi:transposase [Streptomyces olivoreticuli]
MGINLIACDRDHSFVIPQDIREWLPPEHLCWKVLDAVDEMDLSAFKAGYRADGQGHAAYPPGVLLALIVYCCSKGVRSSRRIEAACLDDVGCRVITANHRVDHATVARFLRRHGPALNALFVQVLALCDRRGLVDLTAVAVDGSPMEANAARFSNRSLERLETIISQSEAGIAGLMEETAAYAQAVESGEVGEAREPPRESSATARLSRLSDRLARACSAREYLYARARPSAGEIRIKVEAAERMVVRAEKRLAAVTAAHQAKLDGYARRTREDQASGWRAANGRPPVPLDASVVVGRRRARLARAGAWLEGARSPRPVPSPTARASLSDPDSRLMLDKHGGYLQGYNLQLASARNQLLLAIELQDGPSDMTALVPVVEQAERNRTAAGITDEVQAWLADCGYASTANFEALAGLPLFVALAREGPHSGAPRLDRDAVPAGQRAMAERLDTPAGRSLYRRRASLVEPGFAQLFQRFGRHLNCRSTGRVDTEIKLLGTVHNLNKCFRHSPKSSPLTE